LPEALRLGDPGVVESGSVSIRALSAVLPSGRGATRLLALGTMLFWALFVLIIARVRYQNDIRALLCIGEKVYHPASFETVPRTVPWGYDGQYYAALATDPFLRAPDTIRALDAPSYRATRIMVPLLAWALALGRPAPAIIAYQLLCWAFGVAAVFLLARWLEDEGRSPWWALPLMAGAGLAATMVRTTPDAGALFCMLAALWLHARGRTLAALVLACAAVLGRETSVLVALAIAVDEVRRRRWIGAALFGSVPLGLGLGWQLYLKHAVGTAFEAGTGNFSLPFVWLPAKIPTLFPGGHVWWMEFFGLCAVAATVVALVVVARKPSRWGAPELAFVAFGTMGLFLSYAVYCETWAYARALVVLPFLAVLIAERQPAPFGRWALRSVALLYLVSGLLLVRAEVHGIVGSRGLLAALIWPHPPAGRTAEAGTAAVAARYPLYVLPAANTPGRAGSKWRTRLEIENLAPTANRVEIELQPVGDQQGSRFHTTIALAAGERKSWDNALDELFSLSGVGALRLAPDNGPITASSMTANVKVRRPPGDLSPAISERQALRGGLRARLSGLFYDPSPEAAVRTNIGLLNLASVPLRVRVELYGPDLQPLGRLVQPLKPGEFLQIDDAFAKVHAGPVANGSAVVKMLSRGGALLSYASVIRGPAAPAVYVLPELESAVTAGTGD
jgi:hypothetical protein